MRLVINILSENCTIGLLHSFSFWIAQSASWTAQIGWTARLELALGSTAPFWDSLHIS